MKKLSILGLFIFALISFNSCETEDDVVFTTQSPDGFVFTNATLDSYILTTSTSANLGERFTWDNADFGVPTNTSYELQRSITGDFTDATAISTTTGNEIAVTIGQMMAIATEAGLDADPDSPAPNTGSFSVRVRAFAGDMGGASDAFSNALILNIELLENTGNPGGGSIAPATWGVVGSGYNNWGAFEDATFYTTSTPGVIVSYVNLLDGEIKFRENNTWGGDLGDANGDGVLDADPDNNIAVTAGDYKITIDTSDNSYTIEPFSWGIVGSGFNDWGATLDAKLSYDYTTDTFRVGVQLLDGEIKFRMNNTWGGDLGDGNGDGVLDADADNNIAVTAGHYEVIVNLNDNSYSIETADIWGIVGSGFNDWGATVDFNLTQVNPNIWIAENVTLLDGEIKFRQNDTWGTDLGDANDDGILDADADNNIAVTAGNYVVKIDFTNAGSPVYSLGARQ
ncbi:MAG: SusE domain-containing protein [Winogradskyella sp.]